jgi:predicted MFS family arabinose efflux permease
MDSRPEQQATSVSIAAYVRLLRANRNFRRLWAAQIVSEIGDWFYSLSIYSLLLQLTGKPSSVALALVLQVLPQTFTGPTAGVLNDRIRRRQVMIAADVARVVIVLCMLFVRTRSMVWLVYPLLLLETIMAAFFEPARNSVIPNIVTRDDLIVANTLSATTWSLNLAIGATLGGVVAALLGRNAVFVLNALSFLASALLISGMHFIEPHAEHGQPFRARELVDFSPIRDGVRYIASDLRLLATVFAKSGIGFLGAGWVYFTVMGAQLFPITGGGMSVQRGSMLSISLLWGSRGVGALIGPLYAASWAGRQERRLRAGILIGFLMGAIGYLLLGGAPSLWVACALVIFAHCGTSTVWVFSSTLLQLNTDDRFRGRVFSADFGLCMLVIAVAGYVAGVLLDAGVSVRVLASATGACMILPFVIWAFALRLWKEQPQTVVRS